jgi:hypothetical protein
LVWQPRRVEDHAGMLGLDNLGIGIPLDIIYADSGVGQLASSG